MEVPEAVIPRVDPTEGLAVRPDRQPDLQNEGPLHAARLAVGNFAQLVGETTSRIGDTMTLMKVAGTTGLLLVTAALMETSPAVGESAAVRAKAGERGKCPDPYNADCFKSGAQRAFERGGGKVFGKNGIKVTQNVAVNGTNVLLAPDKRLIGEATDPTTNTTVYTPFPATVTFKLHPKAAAMSEKKYPHGRVFKEVVTDLSAPKTAKLTKIIRVHKGEDLTFTYPIAPQTPKQARAGFQLLVKERAHHGHGKYKVVKGGRRLIAPEALITPVPPPGQ